MVGHICQKYRNMETLHFVIKSLHIAAGAGTLFAGMLAIFFNFKEPRWHRLCGQIFTWSMVWVCLSALVGFAFAPQNIFFQFLVGIAFFTMLNVAKGVRSMRFMLRKAAPGAFDRGITVVAFLTGLAMLGAGILYFTKGGDGLVIGILFTIFGLSSLSFGRNWQKLLNKGTSISPKHWYHEHIVGMLGAFIASNTAFLVNTTGEWMHPLIQFALPTVLLMPVIMFFTKKLKVRPQDLS